MSLKPFTAEGRFECGFHDIVKGKLCALVPVVARQTGKIGLGVAVANERGYNPIPVFWCHSDTYDEMAEHAEQLNRELFQLDHVAAMRIIVSTMRKEIA
jgi:hypothetical protein